VFVYKMDDREAVANFWKIEQTPKGT